MVVDKIERIICGDNLEILKNLDKESVDLIYIDPPFFTNKHYAIIWGDMEETRQFGDRWITESKNGSGRASKDINIYLEWMKLRLDELYPILKKTGSFYIHCDDHVNGHLRLMCDEKFGKNNFRGEIIWVYGGRESQTPKQWAHKHDTILYYTKSKIWTFNPQYKPYREEYLKFFKKDDNDGKGKYQTQPDGKGGRYKQYLNNMKGQPINDVWIDIRPLYSFGKQSEFLGYPTQKPEALLKRIILASSNPMDIVLDAFCGCGTTLDVANKFNRQWIGIDVSPTACRLIAKRLNKKISTIEGLPIKESEIKELNGYEFQNWIIREMGGISGKKGADGGIDGEIGNMLIQVKKSTAGRNQLDTFVGMLAIRKKKKEGIFIALKFSTNFRAEVARLKKENDIIIHYFDVNDIINKKHFKALKKAIPGVELNKHLKYNIDENKNDKN